jgi:hypothetical protein
MSDEAIWLEIVCAALKGGKEQETAKQTADALLSAFQVRFPKSKVEAKVEPKETPNESEVKASAT